MRQTLILLAGISFLCDCLPEGSRDIRARTFAHTVGSRTTTNRPSQERGIVALNQALRELTNPFTVMSVAAHPDDMDTGALAYYRKKLGARTAIVFATRGEGGRWTVSHAEGEDLGVARTREALEAASILGADSYFLNLPDFGESKTPEEALNVWGYREALSRMVRAIRLIRPDVIITDHEAETGGGQHQAIGRLVLEAFEAAADAKQFAEEDAPAWQARRIFRRSVENTLGVMVNPGEYDHLRGRTYAEIARAAVHRRRAEGYATDPSPPETERAYYQLIRSASNEGALFGGTLFDGLTLPQSLARSIASPRVGQSLPNETTVMRERLIESLKEKLIEKRAEGSIREIHTRYGAEFHRMVRFIETLERALALALGISFDVTLSDRLLVAGQKVSARLSFHNGSDLLLPIVFHAPESLPVSGKEPSYKASEVVQAPPGQATSQAMEYELPKDAPLTLPYANHLYEESYYPTASALVEPFGHSLSARVEIGLGQTALSLPASIRFDVAPPIEISTIPFALIKDWATPRDFEFSVILRNRAPGEFAGALWVVPLAITVDDYEPVHVRFAREDEEIKVDLKLKLPILRPPLAPDILIEFRRERPAPPAPLAYWKIAVFPAVFSVAANISVGYIRGFDSWLAKALAQLGVEHHELEIDEINAFQHGHTDQAKTGTNNGCAKLSRFDTIIVDELAYSARPDIVSICNCLIEYARRGGNLIVLYQKSDDWNALANRSPAPFPIKLSNNHITVEAALIKIIAQDHPLMRKPNEITEKDFEGWTQDRAYYLPQEWADQYTAVLESNDPGEESQRGGLLAARYEQGIYVYTSYSWRRQSMEANPGAYRMLANLVSLAKTMKESPGEQK